MTLTHCSSRRMQFLSRAFAILLFGLTSRSAFPVEQFSAMEPDSPGNESLSLIDDPKIKHWIYGGVNLGYSHVAVSTNTPESPKNGMHLGLKALYSRYAERWVYDAGLGWTYHNVSGTDSQSPLANPKVKVITRAGMVELSARYRFNSNWQLGPVVNVIFGEDVSFDESAARDNSTFSALLGPRVQYELPTEKGRWRFGAQILTDLLIAHRQIWSFQADIQYGIPIDFGGRKEEPTPIAEPAPPPPPPPARPQAPRFAEVTSSKGVKIYLGEAVLRFRTGSSNLQPSSRQILIKVSGYLKKYDRAWATMRIEGHTDVRGSLKLNERLARQRADTVERELKRLGIEEGRMVTAGFGPRRPIDPARNAEAYALNRRVELWLEGVTDPQSITRDLNDLR